jgi:hypothetical protein
MNMPRNLRGKTNPDDPWQPANAIQARFGVSPWTLRTLALAKRIRTREESAVYLSYCVADVQQYLEHIKQEPPRPRANQWTAKRKASSAK